MYHQILTSIQNGIKTITINREDKMNALNIALLQEIKQAVIEAENNPQVKAIVITGAGQKAFAAGADIAEFSEFDVAKGTEMSRAGHEVMFAIERCSKPVVAAVNGFALGGGCELALSCHMRFASENARFGQPEINLGVPPGYGGTQRLIQIVGKGRALEILLTTDPVKAVDALQIGLVNAVLPQDELLTYTYDKLSKITQKSPDAIHKVIQCVNEHYRAQQHGFDTEITLFGEAFGTTDFKIGTSAFLEKRKPEF